MRPSSLALVLVAASCSNQDKAKPAEQTRVVEPSAPPVAKQPVPTKPLPALATDSGGGTGKPIWQTGFGGLGIDAPRGLAIDAANNVYVAGYFDGTIDFGATIGKKPSAGGSDAFVTKLDANGKLQWAQTFGAKRDDAANGVAV